MGPAGTRGGSGSVPRPLFSSASSPAGRARSFWPGDPPQEVLSLHSVLAGWVTPVLGGGDIPLKKGACLPVARTPGMLKVTALPPQMRRVRPSLHVALGHTCAWPLPPGCVLLPAPPVGAWVPGPPHSPPCRLSGSSSAPDTPPVTFPGSRSGLLPAHPQPSQDTQGTAVGSQDGGCLGTEGNLHVGTGNQAGRARGSGLELRGYFLNKTAHPRPSRAMQG